MSRIVRSKDLGLIGLTEQDLENRAIVATGWMPGELLPPYTDCRERDARRVIDYLDGKDFIREESCLLLDDIRRRLNPLPRLVEVVGGLADGCSAVTAHWLVEAGTIVYVNPELVITRKKDKYPPYWVGRIFLRSILSESPDHKCQIYGKIFLFYKQSRD